MANPRRKESVADRVYEALKEDIFEFLSLIHISEPTRPY